MIQYSAIFQGISLDLSLREEHEPIEEYCLAKKLRIQNEIVDEEIGAVYDSDSEEENVRVKRPAEDLDSESEDLDFQGGSDSDVAEEFDEEYSSSEDEDGEEPKKDDSPKKVKPSKVSKEPPKKKAKKDPNAPKKALTSFILFSNAKRSEITRANPGISIGDVAKQLGALWKQISASEKEKYDKLALQDKERYEREMAAYKKGEVSKPESSKEISNVKTESKFKSEEIIDSD